MSTRSDAYIRKGPPIFLKDIELLTSWMLFRRIFWVHRSRVTYFPVTISVTRVYGGRGYAAFFFNRRSMWRPHKFMLKPDLILDMTPIHIKWRRLSPDCVTGHSNVEIKYTGHFCQRRYGLLRAPNKLLDTNTVTTWPHLPFNPFLSCPKCSNIITFPWKV